MDFESNEILDLFYYEVGVLNAYNLFKQSYR